MRESKLTEDIQRDISGETLCGFRVAAYRETHPKYGDQYGHRYSEHWSTPSQNPAVTVERLFTETQLRAALSRAPEVEELGGSTRCLSPASRSQTPLSAGHRLCEAFATTFEGGGWADAPEWAEFDEDQQRRWDRTATLFLRAFSDKGWQDIASAPKSEQDVLLSHAGAVFTAHWSEEDAGWVDGATNDYGEYFTYPATHWMPLPTPPAEDGLSGPQRSEVSPQAPDHTPNSYPDGRDQ